MGSFSTWLKEWLELSAHQRALSYLNYSLAKRLGDKKGTTYAWQLRGSDAAWRQLMYGNSLDTVLACTVIVTQGKRIAIGASFHMNDLVAPECFPLRTTLTEVLPYLTYSPAHSQREPRFFNSYQEFIRIIT